MCRSPHQWIHLPAVVLGVDLGVRQDVQRVGVRRVAVVVPEDAGRADVIALTGAVLNLAGRGRSVLMTENMCKWDSRMIIFKT